MKRALTLAFLIAAVAQAQSSCPTIPPNGNFRITVGCNPCLAGQPSTLNVIPNTDPCLLEPYDCVNGPYSIQGCDTVAWTFGDGTTATGGASIAHTYAAGGYFEVSAVVTNSKGTSPARRNTITVGNANPTTVTISLPASIPEFAAAQVVTLTRSGDLTATSKIFYFLNRNSGVQRIAGASGTLQFTSGESQKTLTFPLVTGNDAVWSADSNYTLTVQSLDATVLAGLPQNPNQPTNVSGKFDIVDDDPRPHFRIHNASVLEGDANLTFAQVTGTLDVPFGLPFASSLDLAFGGDDIQSLGSARFEFAPGQTSAIATIMIKGDRKPEPDEPFPISVVANSDAAMLPLVEQPNAILTILNDDIGFGQEQLWMSVGESIAQPIDLGTPLTADSVLTLTADQPSIKLTPSIAIGQSKGTVKIDGLQGLDTVVTAKLVSPERTSNGSLLVHVFQPSTLTAQPETVRLRVGEEATLRIAFSPTQASAATVTAQPQGLGVVTVLNPTTEAPAGGEAVFRLRGVMVGKTSLIVYSPGQVATTTVAVEVVAASSRHRAAKP